MFKYNEIYYLNPSFRLDNTLMSPPGNGFKDVTITDGISLYHSDNLFEYINPCLSSCISPWVGNDCMSKIVVVPQPSLNYSNPSIPLFERSNNSNNDSTYFYKTKIAAIVICGFLGILTISTIIIYHYYKKRHDRNVINEIRLKLTTKKVDILMY
ncbi:hypothetical protein ACTFIU_000964 [Dictyostelium citrinum]